MNNSLDASARDLTLVDLFEATVANFGTPATAAILTVGALAPLQTAVLAELSYFPWNKFVTSLGPKALELLQIRLLDILVGVWQKSREVLEYRDKARHPPTEEAMIPLIQRSITSDFHPYIEILFRGKTYPVVFDIELKLTMKEIFLEIQNARIKAVHSGSLQGSGSISLLGAELMKKQFPPVNLPGIVKLGQGIRI
jgi:hypothetical protein